MIIYAIIPILPILVFYHLTLVPHGHESNPI